MGGGQWVRKVQSPAKDYRNLSNVEQNARAYGDAVVVIGVYLEKMKIKGKDADRRVRFTDTWIFQNSHWEWCSKPVHANSPQALKPTCSFRKELRKGAVKSGCRGSCPYPVAEWRA